MQDFTIFLWTENILNSVPEVEELQNNDSQRYDTPISNNTTIQIATQKY